MKKRILIPALLACFGLFNMAGTAYADSESIEELCERGTALGTLVGNSEAQEQIESLCNNASEVSETISNLNDTDVEQSLPAFLGILVGSRSSSDDDYDDSDYDSWGSGRRSGRRNSGQRNNVQQRGRQARNNGPRAANRRTRGAQQSGGRAVNSRGGDRRVQRNATSRRGGMQRQSTSSRPRMERSAPSMPSGRGGMRH